MERLVQKLSQGSFFYGWVIVGVGLLVGFVTGAVWNPNVSVFVKPIAEELGWARATVSGAITVGAISGGLLGALLGPLIDRRGPRWILVGSMIVMGISLVSLSQANSVVHFYLGFGIARMIATGAVTLAMSVAVSNWFVSKRGRAMAIALLGDRFGSAILPLLSQYLVLTRGWRIGWMGLGFLVWGIGILPSALFLRRKPEDMGMRPDGGAGEIRVETGEVKPEPIWTAREALRTRAFWLVALACSQTFMIIGGTNLHQLPHMTDVGISPSIAVGAISLASVVAAVTSILWGLLSERFQVRYCLIIVFLSMVASLIMLMMVRSVPMAYAYAVVWGLSLGGSAVLVQLIWPYYFGRLSLGTIRGLAWPMQMMANAVGPLIAGLVYDNLGSYQYAFIFFAAVSLLSVVWMLLVRTPHRSNVEER
jgi:MFS family permease